VQHPRHDHPGYAWAALGALVLVADLTGTQTMSEAFRTCSRHKLTGPPLAIGWVVLNAHLFGLIPAKYDPFHRAFCRRCSHVNPDKAGSLNDLLLARGTDAISGRARN
jgi:hypothetical protein